MSEYISEIRYLRKRKGLCLGCGNPKEKERKKRTLCIGCSDRAKIANQKYRIKQSLMKKSESVLTNGK